MLQEITDYFKMVYSDPKNFKITIIAHALMVVLTIAIVAFGKIKLWKPKYKKSYSRPRYNRRRRKRRKY